MSSKVSSINQLLSAVSESEGFARANLYSVEMPRINGIGGYELNLLCKNVQLPSRQISTVQREIGINTTNVGYGVVTGNLNMTFRVMNDERVRSYFEAWQQLVIPNLNKADTNTHNVGYYKDYVKTIKINQLRREVNVPLYEKQMNLKIPSGIRKLVPQLGPFNIAPDKLGDLFEFNIGKGGINFAINLAGASAYTCTLHEAYPVTIQYEALSDDNTGQLSEINIEFAYRNWTGQTRDDRNPLNRLRNFVEGISADVTDVLTEQIQNAVDNPMATLKKVKDKII